MSKIKEFIKNISPLNNRTEMPVILYIIKIIIIFGFVKFGSELIGEAFAIGIHFVCGKNPLNGEMFDGRTILLITYYGYALMIGVLILYWKLFQKKTLAGLGFNRKFGSYFAGAAIGAVLAVASVFAVMLTGTLTYNGVFSNIDYTYIVLMFGGFVFQGALEEVLCRGIVLQLLKEKTSIPVAVGISTALFVIPHISNMSEADPAIIVFAVAGLIIISLIFSALTLRFNSIWAACGLHSVWNFILYNILGLNLSGNDELTAAVFDMKSVGSNILNGGVYGIEASVVTAAVLILALVLICAVSASGHKNSLIKLS